MCHPEHRTAEKLEQGHLTAARLMRAGRRSQAEIAREVISSDSVAPLPVARVAPVRTRSANPREIDWPAQSHLLGSIDYAQETG